MNDVLMLKRRRQKMRPGRIVFILSFIIYPLILFSIFYVAVNINSILLAFEHIDIYGNVTFAGFSNFKTFLTSMFSAGEIISTSFVNSLKIYIISLAICMPIYIAFSYLLFKQCFLHKTIRVVVMLPQIISGFVICLLFVNFVQAEDAPLRVLFGMLGIFTDESGLGIDLLHDERYALGTTIFYAIWISFGTNLIVYPNAMKEINSEIIESAQLDGIKNGIQELWYIILPLIFPTLETFLITGLAAIFSNEGGILTFYNINAPSYVYNMGYYYTRMIKTESSEVNYPNLAAGGLIMTIIVAPLTLLLRRVLEKYGPSED